MMYGYFNLDTLKNSELAKIWTKTLADLHKYELISSNIIVVNDFGSLFKAPPEWGPFLSLYRFRFLVPIPVQISANSASDSASD